MTAEAVRTRVGVHERRLAALTGPGGDAARPDGLAPGADGLRRARDVGAAAHLGHDHVGRHVAGALRGVVSMLRRIAEDEKPDYFAVVFDAPGKTFRDAWYPEYKANRPPMPDDLVRQIAHHDHCYYVLDQPEISDAEYDRMFRELQALESDHPELRRPDSPTLRVGGKALDKFNKFNVNDCCAGRAIGAS